MLFNKKMPTDCAYCEYGFLLTNKENCICKKYGPVKRRYKCSKFRYNPLLRQPEKAPEIVSDGEYDIN